MSWWNPLSWPRAAVGGVVSGIANYKAQKSANETNIAEGQKNRDFQAASQREAETFNAEQAQKQMDFQERMSNTAYERATGSMIRAGLNPALAYSQGPASSPSGSSGSVGSSSGSQAHVEPASLGPAISGAISNAFEKKRLDNETNYNIAATYAKEQEALMSRTGAKRTAFEQKLREEEYETLQSEWGARKAAADFQRDHAASIGWGKIVGEYVSGARDAMIAAAAGKSLATPKLSLPDRYVQPVRKFDKNFKEIR